MQGGIKDSKNNPACYRTQVQATRWADITVDDVDVVTTGTFGVMSGTMAVMMVQVSEKCSFERADRIWLNGVPAQPGP